MPPPPPEPLYVLRGHRAAVQCVAFLPNSKALAAGDAEGDLKLWDLESQRPADSIRAHDSTSGILQVACPTSQPWVLSQGRDGMVKCWELHSGSSFNRQLVQQVESGCYNFCRFALLEPGQTSSSCRGGQQQQQQQQQQVTAAAPHNTVQHMPAQEVGAVVDGFSPSAEAAALASGVTTSHNQQPHAGLLSMQLRQQQQQQLQQQQLQQQQLQQQQDDLCVQVSSLGLQEPLASQAAGTASAADEDEVEDLTEAAEEQLMLRTTTGSAPCLPSATTAQAGIINTSSSSCAVSVSAAAAAAEAGTTQTAAGPCYLALPCEDPAQLGIWQLGAGGAGVPSSSSGSSGSRQRPHMLLTQSKGPQQPQRGQCMAVVLLQPQGRPLHVLTGHEDGSVALWDTRNSSTCLAAQQLHTEPIMCLAAAPDCSSGFSGSADIHLASFSIDIAKGHLIAGPKLPLQQPGLSDIAMRSDGRIAATAGWDAKVRVWACRKRQPLAVLRWHSQQVACVGYSGDNVLLAAGGRDNFISMWSLYPPQ